MALQGKGFFIWKVRDCEGGSPQGIVSAAKSAGLTHVIVKVADGNGPVNIDPKTSIDLVPPVIKALKDAGLKAWGWQFIYGSDPQGEARIAIQRIRQLDLEGFVIDAESEFKQPGKDRAAKVYTAALRSAFPNLTLALSSFRFPSLHMAFPWAAFLTDVDINMPQVYWEQAHNAGAQLTRCVNEFNALNPVRPVIPTGPTYKGGGWRPTPADMNDFFASAKNLNLPAENFFSWDECKRDLPEVWSSIAQQGQINPVNLGQPPVSPPPGLPQQLFNALNQKDVNQMMKLFYPDAVFIDPEGTVQGADAIQKWWYHLLLDLLPGAAYTIRGVSGNDSLTWVDWSAVSPTATVNDGRDAIGVIDGKIATYSTQFNIVKN